MRESRTYGSVRGALSDERPYRDPNSVSDPPLNKRCRHHRREGFEAIVIEDACRGIDLGGSVAATRASFAANKISCIRAEGVRH